MRYNKGGQEKKNMMMEGNDDHFVLMSATPLCTSFTPPH